MSRKVVFAVEPLAKAFAEASELLRMHWHEVAPYKEINRLNPDMDNYLGMENAGRLCLITARSNGELVGYIMLLIYPHPHYKHVINATDDLHFLHMDYRNGFTFMRMLAFAEQEMANRGVQIMALRTKVDRDHGALFVRLGYKAQDVTYTKRLGD